MTALPGSRDWWQSLLQPSETLLWFGQPDAGFRFKSNHLLLAALGVILTAGFVWQIGTITDWSRPDWSSGAWIMVGVWTAFTLAIAGLMIGSPWLAHLRRQRMRYALSDQRAFIYRIAVKGWLPGNKAHEMAIRLDANTRMRHFGRRLTSLEFMRGVDGIGPGRRQIRFDFEFILEGKAAIAAFETAIQAEASGREALFGAGDRGDERHGHLGDTD